MHKTNSIFALVFLCVVLSSGQSVNAQENAVDTFKPQLSLSQKQRWKLMIGKWYGKQPTKSGGMREWLVTRYPNGTYKTVFHVYSSTGIRFVETIEAGEWGIVESVYFTIFKGNIESGKLHKVDATDPYHRDAYQVLTLDRQQLVYQSLSSGNQYSVTRVDADFTLGEPADDPATGPPADNVP